ncbi:efflux RND transporter periplasmic adaptor subunit [Pseudohaliea rubra]|uniref:RND efflux membrane fusion protein n=1 Tax=Pseudohaliea rubra DSM 19751 TaxID=1265313 RepID=A0A095XZ39_9GAMM|nr:efflux RND transporter periplasmic adaptor subunit [Pseudohaliea rubra]KGE05016.1 RND efflux membrane fusion protein [Pseudohaliea rubra DSM 19751]
MSTVTQGFRHLLARLSFLFAVLPLALAGCGDGAEAPAEPPPPVVRTVVVAPDDPAALRLSAVIRARVEAPLTFQRPGRIVARHVDTGETVPADQLLFSLDDRRERLELTRAEAALAAATAEADNARTELARQRDLVARELTSRQALDAASLLARATEARLAVAESELGLARVALAETELRAPAAGTVMRLETEVGAVLRPEAPALLFAKAGPREAEVFLGSPAAPPTATLWHGGEAFTVELREQQGVADTTSRGWRTRYQLPAALQLPLGSVASLSFTDAGNAATFTVPLAAVDERGEGPQLWRVVDGRSEPIPVTVVAVDREEARVRGDLNTGDTVIALGTHLLAPGMRVREQGP